MEENLVFLQISKGYDEKSIRELSPLTLAFIGDGVYELIVRTYILDRNKNPNKLHLQASSIVKAKAQAESMLKIEKELFEDELSIYKRGRNAKSKTTAKNQSIIDYRVATGLEALFGYLYLLNRGDRIIELFKKMEDIK